MPGPLSMILPLISAGVLVASGIAKLLHPDDLVGWTALGVPRMLRRQWLVAVHPWAEIALALALAFLGGGLGLLSAVVALGLMFSYLLLVSRVLRSDRDASCACFGTAKPITALTIVRNAWLTLLTVATAGVIWLNPLAGGAIAAVTWSGAWPWVVGAAVAVVTASLIVWPGTGADAGVASSASTRRSISAEPDGLEYVRTRTPSVPVTLADGTSVNLRQLSFRRPTLLLAVSDSCGACVVVRDSVTHWRDLLPEVDIRLLLTAMPDHSAWTEWAEPQSLHDPNGYVRGSIEDDWSTPSAVLFGVDGLLAGGPVTGSDDIAAFIDDIYATLHAEETA